MLKEARPTWLIELHGPECERGFRLILAEHGCAFFDLQNNPIPGDEPLPHHVLAKDERRSKRPMWNKPAYSVNVV